MDSHIAINVMLSIFTHSYSIIMVCRPVSYLQTSISNQVPPGAGGCGEVGSLFLSLKAAALFLEDEKINMGTKQRKRIIEIMIQ